MGQVAIPFDPLSTSSMASVAYWGHSWMIGHVLNWGSTTCWVHFVHDILKGKPVCALNLWKGYWNNPNVLGWIVRRVEYKDMYTYLVSHVIMNTTNTRCITCFTWSGRCSFYALTSGGQPSARPERTAGCWPRAASQATLCFNSFVSTWVTKSAKSLVLTSKLKPCIDWCCQSSESFSN